MENIKLKVKQVINWTNGISGKTISGTASTITNAYGIYTGIPVSGTNANVEINKIITPSSIISIERTVGLYIDRKKSNLSLKELGKKSFPTIREYKQFAQDYTERLLKSNIKPKTKYDVLIMEPYGGDVSFSFDDFKKLIFY